MMTEVVPEREPGDEFGYESVAEREKHQYVERVITAIQDDARACKRRELTQAIDALDARCELTDRQVGAVEDLAETLVSQLLVGPTRSLRRAPSHERAMVALDLFDLPAADTALGGDPSEIDHGSGVPTAASEVTDDD